MKYAIVRGTTSVITHIYLQDSSTGAAKTGLTNSSVTAYYTRPGDSAATSITLTGTVTLGTYTSGGFKEYDATNMPGVYEFHPPDGCFNTTGTKRSVLICIKGSGVLTCIIEVLLTGVDFQDGVRSGLTALPNVASGSAGAVLTAGTGTAQLNVTGGRGDADVLRWTGTAVATPNTAGIPKTDLVLWLGQTPNALSTGLVQATSGGDVVRSNTATAATSTTITLDAGAPTTVDYYRDMDISVVGTTAGTEPQVRTIIGYSSGRVATLDKAFKTTPTGTITFTIHKLRHPDLDDGTLTYAPTTDSLAGLRNSGATTADIADAVWDEVNTGHSGANTFGQNVKDVLAKSAWGIAQITGTVDGSASTPTTTAFSLDSNASTVTDFYKGMTIAFTSGNKAGLARKIKAYATTNKIVTLDAALPSAPSDQDGWTIFATPDTYLTLGVPTGATIAADIAGVQSDTDNLQTRIPAALVSGRMDSSVGAVAAGAITSSGIATGAITAGTFAAGAIDAAAIATDAITSSELAASAAEKIADSLLNRNVAGGSNTGRKVKEALAFLRNKWTISAGTLTVFDTDDATPLFTAAITTTAGNPVSTVDPA
jgi:hypothetical protein